VRRRIPNNQSTCGKTTLENETGRVDSTSYRVMAGRAVGREVDIGKSADRIGTIGVQKHEDRCSRLSRQGLVPVHQPLNGISCLESHCNNPHSGKDREEASLGVGECCTSSRGIPLSVDRSTESGGTGRRR